MIAEDRIVVLERDLEREESCCFPTIVMSITNIMNNPMHYKKVCQELLNDSPAGETSRSRWQYCITLCNQVLRQRKEDWE